MGLGAWGLGLGAGALQQSFAAEVMHCETDHTSRITRAYGMIRGTYAQRTLLARLFAHERRDTR